MQPPQPTRRGWSRTRTTSRLTGDWRRTTSATLESLQLVISCLAPAAERQLITSCNDSNVADVVRRQSPVSLDVVRVRDQPRRVGCGGCIQGVSIIERPGPGVNAAQRQTLAEPAFQVNLKRVV